MIYICDDLKYEIMKFIEFPYIQIRNLNITWYTIYNKLDEHLALSIDFNNMVNKIDNIKLTHEKELNFYIKKFNRLESAIKWKTHNLKLQNLKLKVRQYMLKLSKTYDCPKILNPDCVRIDEDNFDGREYGSGCSYNLSLDLGIHDRYSDVSFNWNSNRGGDVYCLEIEGYYYLTINGISSDSMNDVNNYKEEDEPDDGGNGYSHGNVQYYILDQNLEHHLLVLIVAFIMKNNYYHLQYVAEDFIHIYNNILKLKKIEL
jgi:hypothetical protein